MGTTEQDLARCLAEAREIHRLHTLEVRELRESLRWMAQTVHQAHHDGSIEDCRRSLCHQWRRVRASVDRLEDAIRANQEGLAP